MYQDINASLDIPVFLSPPTEVRTIFLFEPAKTWNIFFPFFLFFVSTKCICFCVKIGGIPGRWKYPAYARSSSMIDVLIPRGNEECFVQRNGKRKRVYVRGGSGGGVEKNRRLRGEKTGGRKKTRFLVTHV